jgi:hypothetical protein
MPNTFVNASQVCTISLTDLYTCPTSNTAGTVNASVVVTVQVANVTNRSDVITLLWTDASNGNAVTRLAFQVSIPANQSAGLTVGKVVLMPGDKLRAQCGIHQALELTMAALETA